MAFTTINKSGDYFNTKLYTGNGGTQSITGVGFQPDWVWIKSRTTGGYHNVFDAVRGVTKRVFTNDAQTEDTSATTLTAFGSDGFSVGSNGDVNGNSQSQVAWNWKAGGSNNGNTNGTIYSTTSVNNTAGFSIVIYTGTGSNGTLGHGLSTAPKMILLKRKDVTANWQVYNNKSGATKALELNGTGGDFTAANRWNSTAPTNTVFSVGNAAEVNAQYGTYVAYCFADVQGYSKFGSYVGNGNADGPFVYTGFKPAFVLTKNISGSNNWTMCDNKRNTFNPTDKVLNPNVSTAEATNNPQDFVSNGFKNRATESNTNSSGSTYIYMAFASAPLVGTNNIPANAR